MVSVSPGSSEDSSLITPTTAQDPELPAVDSSTNNKINHIITLLQQHCYKQDNNYTTHDAIIEVTLSQP